ncbi:GNAT family N-acetyltransferase [Acaryochloris sp. IP29b_bin.137]|uniref:GNAT family N-acetyltransferase n=1 Tax=Acaryochloris sp. IP29b_bin.137 TaxID=2969217 RepID=UPI00344FF69E
MVEILLDCRTTRSFHCLCILKPFKHYSVLEVLYVHLKWSRKGIGSALASQLIQQVQSPIYVESALRAKRFYKRLGFQEIRFRDMPTDVQKQFFLKGRGLTALMVCR